MTPRPVPPRAAERVLAACIADPEWRDAIAGDLREEFAGLNRTRGPREARRWYWRQALAIAGHAVGARLRRGRRPERAWIAPPEQEHRQRWGAGMLKDLGHAARTLLRRPATSAVIVLTLAVALATNSTSVALLDAIVVRPFRFPGVDRVVMVVSSDPQQGLLDRESVSAADFAEWRRETRTLQHLSAAQWWDANLSAIDQPEQVAGHKVTAGFFEALGADPILGRTFTREEEVPGAHRRVVLGHALWTRLFAGDPGIIGRTVRVDGEPFDVVGIAPPGFAIPLGNQIWAPIAYTPDEWADRRGRYLITVARLQDDATLADARAELGAIAERQRREYPDTNAKLPNAVVTFTDGMQDAGAGAFLSLMTGASLLLLVIASANIANLLLARGTERTQEFALRLALGGGRTRLVRQLLLEAGLLAGLATFVAMPLAMAGIGLTRASIPPAIVRFIPGWEYLRLSPELFAVTALLAAAAMALFALVPALQTVRPEIADTLRTGARTTTAGRSRHWLRATLSVAQVAISLALLSASGLMLASVDRAMNGALGFDRDNLLVARVVLPDGPYEQAERRRQFISGVLDRLRSIPAVNDAAMVSNIPYGGNNSSRPFRPEGEVLRESDVRNVDYRRVTPEYATTLRIPLLAGRALTSADRLDSPAVAHVSRSLADRYWPGSDPLGRQFRLAADGPPITVVGVVGDVLHDWFQQRRAPTVYRPLAQDAPYSHHYVARVVGSPLALAGDLRRAVQAMDADLPVIGLQSMEELMEERTTGLNTIAGMLTVVAGMAFGLAMMGLYSLMAFLVSRRTQELGVRMALGATAWQVVRLATGQGLKITAVGIACGALAAIGLGRVMESVLFGIVASSVWQVAGLAGLVAIVALVASYLPARRTASLDPTVALRRE
jgi:predicted permease